MTGIEEKRISTTIQATGFAQYLSIQKQTNVIKENSLAILKSNRNVSDSIGYLAVMQKHSASQTNDLLNRLGYTVADLNNNLSVANNKLNLINDRLLILNKFVETATNQLDEIVHLLKSPLQVQAQEYLDLGLQDYSKGLLEPALRKISLAIEKNDTNFIAQHYLGKLYIYGKDDDEDIIDYELGIKHLLLAVKYSLADSYRSAQALFYLVESYYHLSQCYYILSSIAETSKRNDYLDQSIVYLNEIEKIDGAEALLIQDPISLKLRCILALGDIDSALQIAKNSIEINPENVFLLYDDTFHQIQPELNNYIALKKEESEKRLNSRIEEIQNYYIPEDKKVYQQYCKLLEKIQLFTQDDSYLGFERANESAKKFLEKWKEKLITVVEYERIKQELEEEKRKELEKAKILQEKKEKDRLESAKLDAEQKEKLDRERKLGIILLVVLIFARTILLIIVGIVYFNIDGYARDISWPIGLGYGIGLVYGIIHVVWLEDRDSIKSIILWMMLHSFAGALYIGFFGGVFATIIPGIIIVIIASIIRLAYDLQSWRFF